ncbi:MAG: YqaE/Pmp3 family membrane protein [Bacteroidia bacterium]|jgi:uncharacterized membrane protein YqaE (UPF0057 family)|nr:YqaE/Pmp3 family membrane protein [Bacteroidia bacterium]
MKHNKIVLGFTALVTAVMLFSCSTSDGLTIEKRRYRDGFYVAKNHKKTTKAEEKQAVVQRESITPAQANSVTPNAVTPEALKGEIQTLAEQTPAPQTSKAVTTPATEKQAPSVVTAPLTKKEIREASKAVIKQGKKETKKSPSDDVDPILVILCCIFIPPLGVYLVKGDIDNDFVINLILTVVLCWIGGMIHALIVYSRNK